MGSMVTEQLPKPRRINPLWKALGIGSLFLAIYLFSQRGRPERLIHPSGENLLQDGHLYFSPNNQTIWTQKTDGTEKRQIVGPDPNYAFYPNMSLPLMAFPRFTIINRTLYYSLVPMPKKIQEFGGGFAISARITNLGDFRPPLQKPSPQELAQERRVRVKNDANPLTPILFRRVPVQGGAPQDVCTLFPSLYGWLFHRDMICWIRPHPDETVMVTRGQEQWRERIGHSDLMVTSLQDGISHQICTGLPHDTRLQDEAEGVFWTEPRPFPDQSQDLLYYRPADNQVHRYARLAGFSERFALPVEFKGRLYWYSVTRPSGRIEPVPRTLNSISIDGSDTREELSFVGAKRVPTDILTVCQGSLYSIFESADRAHPEYYLCRLQQGQRMTPEVLARFSKDTGGFHFYQDYLYYEMTERQRSWFDTLTNDDTHTLEVSMLYRFRLPDA